mgnify:CR=1 FL=1
MKKLLIVLLILSMATPVFASYGYITEIATGHVISKFDLPTKPEDDAEYTFTECSEEDMPDLYKEPIPDSYDSDELISWALQQVFAEGLIPHMAAFLDFSNKCTETSKTNFLAYAQAVGLTETANIIVAKAIELGANLED